MIQAKGNLSRIHQEKIEIGTSPATEVDIGEWKATAGNLLYSQGYGGCMAVVINDPTQDRGALAHIFDQIVLRNFGNEEKVEQELRKIIDDMITTIGGRSENLECLIWAGATFSSGIFEGKTFIGFLDSYCWRRFINDSDRVGFKINELGRRGNVIVYDPRTARCTIGNSVSLTGESGRAQNMLPPKPNSYPPISKEESDHRGRISEILFQKGEAYFERSNDQTRFYALAELLEEWCKGSPIAPFRFMQEWKDKIG